MTALNIRPLPVLGSHESFVLIDDLVDTQPFIDEAVVRQMILDGSPDDLPATGNPSLTQSMERQRPIYPLAFAS